VEEEDVVACLMPFDLNSRRANAQGHPRSAAATRHPSKSATSSHESEAKNPQFRIDTDQRGAFDYLFNLRDCSIGQFADCFSSPEIFDENGGGSEVGARKAAPGHQNKSQAARGRDYGWALHYGSINFPLAALIAASVRVAAPSLPRALSV